MTISAKSVAVNIPLQTTLKKYPDAVQALSHNEPAQDDWSPSSHVGFRWIFEVIERLQMLPGHAKAFGWKHMTDGAVATLSAALTSYWMTSTFNRDDSTMERLSEHFRTLSLVYRARDVLRLPKGAFRTAAMTDDEIVSWANRDAAEVRQTRQVFTSKVRYLDPLDEVFQFPDAPKALTVQPISKVNLTDSLKAYSPERRIRMARQRRRECSLWISQALEIVGDHKGKMATPYASKPQIADYTADQVKQEAWGARRVLKDDEGAAVSMLTVLKTKKHAQMSQFYAIAKGLQAIADGRGWDYAMITLTLPGEWHSARTGTASGRFSEWNGCSPADAVRELQRRWNALSTRIKQLVGDQAMGFSIKEPHADGTGHQHAFLSGSREALVAVREYLIDYAAREGEDVSALPRGVFENTKVKDVDGEVVAETVIVDFLAWKPADQYVDKKKKASSPATYMFKYLAKGLLSPDVSAWKSCVNIRQISWINFGRGFVAKWQACYQAKKVFDKDGFLPGQSDVLEVVQSMVVKDWGKALSTVLALEVVKDDFVGPAKSGVYKLTEERVNQYGEVRTPTVGFCTVSDGEVISAKSSKHWVVEKLPAAQVYDPIKDPALVAERNAISESLMSTILHQCASMSEAD